MTKKHDHPWWHFIFTSLICVTITTGNWFGAKPSTRITYKCTKCKAIWDVDPHEGYEVEE